MLSFPENFQIVPCFSDITDANSGARTGDWINLEGYEGAWFVWNKNDGITSTDLTFLQAQDNAGTGSKNLAVVTDYYHKRHATDTTATPTFTHATQAASATVEGSGTEQELTCIPIRSDQLDLANGFTHVAVQHTDPGNAQIIDVIAYLVGGRYKQEILATAQD